LRYGESVSGNGGSEASGRGCRYVRIGSSDIEPPLSATVSQNGEDDTDVPVTTTGDSVDALTAVAHKLDELLEQLRGITAALQRGRIPLDSPYLTPEEAARYLRFQHTRAFNDWVSRNGVPRVKRGRTALFERKILEAFIRDARWTRRHKPPRLK
jgi:hypothetical protein